MRSISEATSFVREKTCQICNLIRNETYQNGFGFFSNSSIFYFKPTFVDLFYVKGIDAVS